MALKALLVLADGRCLRAGASARPARSRLKWFSIPAWPGTRKLLTDPSYYGQIVNMTYPLIGNYGINAEDVESAKIQVSGFIVRELCRWPSNYRSHGFPGALVQSAGDHWASKASIPAP